MDEMSENKMDVLAKRIERGEKLETGELLALLDSLILKNSPRKKEEA